MTPSVFNWALVAVSLFNTIMLLWLGLTLWLNADRRNLGIAVTSSAFVLGSLFFVSHSALLLSETWQFTRSNTLWLAAGMVPVLMLPFAWYVVLLWYAGFWQGDAALRLVHTTWLATTTTILIAGFTCLALLAIPFLPGLSALTSAIWPARQFIKTPVFGVPLVAIGFPLYVLLCVTLSLDALRRPGAGSKAFGDIARERARPWLTAATALLLAVGMLVAIIVVWTIKNTREGAFYVLRSDDLRVIAWFDLVIALLLAAVAITLTQAMSTYELFTGRTLPRRRLAHHAQQALTLTAGYAVFLGGALVWGLEAVYGVLGTAVLMTAFFALQSRRAYEEWQQAIRQLRPFVTSRRWYESLTGELIVAGTTRDPLGVLCEDILNASAAYLIPGGPLASLIPARVYPPGLILPESLPPLEDAGIQSAVPLRPGTFGEAAWAVPLGTDERRVGWLLLGNRTDESLFTEEEIEVARSAGEGLLDAAASLALSQRLMSLQREQMVQNQLLDQRTRRILHDEVLPLIHTAMLSVAAGAQTEAALARLSEAHIQVSTLLRELPATTTPDVARLGPIGALMRAVESELAPAFENVTWECDAAAEARARALAPIKAETLYYAARELVRNAARHARPARAEEGLRLNVRLTAGESNLRLTVEDNGRAPVDMLRAGHGLDLHSTLMAIAGGSLIVTTVPGQCTRGELVLPG